MPIDTSPGGTDIVDISGNGKGADINSDQTFLFETDKGLDNLLVYLVNGNQVLGPRISGMPAAATDLASAITLLNFIRASILTHGFIVT
jgi:hypothetical protein